MQRTGGSRSLAPNLLTVAFCGQLSAGDRAEIVFLPVFAKTFLDLRRSSETLVGTAAGSRGSCALTAEDVRLAGAGLSTMPRLSGATPKATGPVLRRTVGGEGAEECTVRGGWDLRAAPLPMPPGGRTDDAAPQLRAS